jgi:hypothetical protein
MLSDFFAQKIKGEFGVEKKDKVRLRTMEVIDEALVPFVFKWLNALPEPELADTLLTLLNDMIFFLFGKMQDIYCVLPALETVRAIVLSGLSNKLVKNQLFSFSFAEKLLVTISTPNLHVPQYNFKTRS